MKKGFIYAFLLCIVVANFCQTLKADSPSVSEANKPTYNFKHPTDWLDLSGDLRFRYMYDNNRKLNDKDIGHERSQLRLRARVQAKINLTDDLDFNIRLITEPRYFIEADAEPHKWAYNEALFDKFNLTWRNAFGQPLTIVAGRQDIVLGTGWLVSDGTPLDGSRSGFFDALRFTYNLKNWDATADVILINNHGDSAKWLKPINDRDIDLSEQDEQGGIFYFNKKTSKDSGFDVYMIYKHDTKRVAKTGGTKGEIYTPGARLYGKLTDHWQYSAEFAPQFGNKNGKDLNSFGTNDQLIYNFNDKNNNKIYLGYEYLSGNKDQNKYFDKGWGRIDSWSSLYQGNIDAIDGRAYESSNLHRIYTDWATNLTEKLSLKTGYALLFADKNTTKAGTNGLNDDGRLRGHLVKTMLSYKQAKNIEHRVEGELFFPGNYYKSSRNNTATFFRYTLLFTW
jgi:hypothetical protein